MRQRPGPFPDTEPRCTRLSRFAPVLPLLLLLLSAAVLFGNSSSFACEESGGFQICLSYYTENYLRLPQVDRTLFRAETQSFFTKHADGVMRQRNELRLDLHYSPDPDKYTFGIPLEFNLRVRPFYDTAYDMTGWGQGQYRKYLVPDWNKNLNGSMDDQYDPLLREYYVDIRPKNLFVRVGRQIISWGKSDGVYMLDILNPFNLANPTNFDEQYNKIPIWAVNANYQVTSTGTLQFVYEPKYLPYYYPGLPLKGGLPYQGGYQDFTPNVVSTFNAAENGLFGFKIPVDYHQPSIAPSNGIYAARWSDEAYNIHYTLNYVYGWTAYMIQFPNTGNFTTATSVLEQPRRVHIAGASFDYEFQGVPAPLEGTVIRGETAITVGDRYYEGIVGNPVNTDHWGLLLGLDKYIGSDQLQRPIFASFQYWHDDVVNKIHCPTCGADQHEFEAIGFAGSKSGMRAAYYSLLTMYLDKTWLSGDYIDTSFFTLYELQFKDWWLQPQIAYRINDKTKIALGFNIFAGSKQTPYGQYTNATNVYFTLSRVLL
jgi:hypothetical protein